MGSSICKGNQVAYSTMTMRHLLIGLLSPKIDSKFERIDGSHSPGRESDVYKPFEQRLPEFRLCQVHTAFANGHIEVMREIIKVNPSLCRLEGRGKNSATFCSSPGEGGGDVIGDMEMPGNCDRCMEDVTVQGETMLPILPLRTISLKAFGLGKTDLLVQKKSIASALK